MSVENGIKTEIKTERGGRIMNQPGFVLHTIRYKESSLIVDLFTRDYGRVSVIAKGAKRPASKLRAVLHSFQPLSLTWSGKSELKTLTTAEWLGGIPALEKSSLLYGFYLNELLMKLLAREDPHQTLYDRYVRTINELSEENSAPIVLRKFELALLKSMGVAGDFSVCTETDKTVLSDGKYVVDPEKGARPARVSDTFPIVSGKTLIDMMNENYADAQTQTQSKILMRFLLGHHLGNAPVKTRQMLIDLMQL